jgi:PAS domain S-box-containing protein
MKSRYAQYLLQLGALAAAYALVGRLGLLLWVQHGPLWLLWPASGLALAALLRFGTHLWPAITLGSLIHTLLTQSVSFPGALGIASANTLQAVTAVALLRRAGFRNELERLRDILALAGLAGFVAPVIGACLGIASMIADQALPADAFLRRSLMWWSQNAMSNLLVTPFLLTWSVSPRPRRPAAPLAAAALLVVLAGVSTAVFVQTFSLAEVAYPLAYAVFPLLIWAALWFGPRGAATATFLVAVVAAIAAAQHAPRFSEQVFLQKLIQLQAFLAVASITALALAAAAAERQQAEGSRLRSELQFRLIWERSVDGMRLLNTDGTILQVNASFCRMVGMEEERLVGQPFTIVHAESERPALLQRFRDEAQQKKLEAHLEQEVDLWNGQRLWVEVSNSTLQATGEPPLVLSIFRDITLRKRTEEALHLGAERYRSLFEANPHPMWVFDEETLAFVAVNDAAVAHYGYTSDEFLHMSILDMRPPEEVPRLMNFLSDRRSNKQRAGVWRHRKKDGTLIDVEISSHEIQFNERPARVVLANDITERLRTESAIRSSEAKYRSLVENLEQSVFLKDRDLCFVAANKRFCESVNRAETDIVGRTDYDLYPRRLAERYRTDDYKVLEQGRRAEVEEQTLIAGNPRTVRIVKTPVKDDQGQIVGVLGIFWDVTDQRSLEAQLRQAQKMEAVGQLAGGVAHDFNNLLTVILGNLSLVLSKWPPADEAPEMLDSARKAGQRAAELTKQLLGFSRRTVLRPQAINLNTCIDETVAMLRRAIDPRITLETKTMPELGTVHADPGQMNQVLMNLCINSRDAMPDGGRLYLEAANVHIDESQARLTVDAQPGDYVRLRVRDTGHGIPPEIRARIFEPFFTTKELGKGTGLGLAMVFGIVKQHKGWIECHSDVGRGTRFDIYLPQSTAPPPEQTALAPMRRQGHETILLVDDEAMIRQLGQKTLQQHGYQVLLAENGLQGLTIYQREMGKIDLVILDLSMPQISGRDTLKHLRRLDPNVRVLFSSGFSAETVTETEADGVVGFLSKPYSPVDMVDVVGAVLERSRRVPAVSNGPTARAESPPTVAAAPTEPSH